MVLNMSSCLNINYDQEEDSDSNAVVAESALDRLACGLGGKTVFPQIMALTPNMLQVMKYYLMFFNNKIICSNLTGSVATQL